MHKYTHTHIHKKIEPRTSNRSPEKTRRTSVMAQGITTLILIIETLFLVGFASHVVAQNDKDVIHVAGKVLCQDCSVSYQEWINGSRPINGAVVSLTCLDERKRTMYYGSDETDEKGQFDLIVNKIVHGKELKTQFCTVRLVSSPDRSCNIPTDFGKGQTGVKLIRPFSVYRDLVKFVVGPFFYTTPMCDGPKMDDNGDNGGNY